MKLIVLAALFVVTLALPAQETRRTVTHNAANAADDTRANSDTVPAVAAVDAHISRVVILRFKLGTDLLAGLQQAVKQHGIHNAVILSGFGSVRGYQVHQVINRDVPPKDELEKNPTQPADILSISGMVMNGRVHPHITLATPEHAFGGHLEPDTTVFTFAVVTLGVLDDSLDLTKVDDWNNR